MSPAGEILIGIVIVVALFGIVIPVLPGSALIVGAVFVWSFFESSPLGWVVFAVVLALGAAATIAKYLIPGRRLKESGVATSTLVIATGAALVGFFAIPLLGAPIFFFAAIYVIEWSGKGRENAWPATLRSAGAIALSIGIELGAGILMFGMWLVAAIFA